MTWLAVRLFLGGALRRLSGVFGWIGRNPWPSAVIALCGACVWLWLGWNRADARADRWQSAHKALAGEYTKAQQIAAARQADADRRVFVLKTDLAEKAHAIAIQSAADTRDAVRRYADAHPVRLCRKAPDGSASGTSGAGLPGDPGQPADPDPAADLVAVTRADLDTLSGKAVQDSVKAEFLNALVSAGLAVPASKVPEVGFANPPK